MEPNAAEPVFEPAPEPHLELLPALDEVTSEERRQRRPKRSSLLRRQPRTRSSSTCAQIGDGRLLTVIEERELARRKDEGDEAAKRS